MTFYLVTVQSPYPLNQPHLQDCNFMQHHALKQLYPIAIQAIAPLLYRNHDHQPKTEQKLIKSYMHVSVTFYSSMCGTIFKHGF
jgi:hypothetical protein